MNFHGRISGVKSSAFWWTIALGKILIIDNLRKKRRREVIMDGCCVYWDCGETVNYLLLHCAISRHFWPLALSLFWVCWVMPQIVMEEFASWKGRFRIHLVGSLKPHIFMVQLLKTPQFFLHTAFSNIPFSKSWKISCAKWAVSCQERCDMGTIYLCIMRKTWEMSCNCIFNCMELSESSLKIIFLCSVFNWLCALSSLHSDSLLEFFFL